MGNADAQETLTEGSIRVRQVTSMQASWTEAERGAPGAFTIQLILDSGAEEYVLRPAADDMEPLLKLFKQSSGAAFDLDRKVLIFNGLAM
jgi:hypothetical protein